MNQAVLCLAVLALAAPAPALAAPASADELTPDFHLARARDAHVRGDFAAARAELLAAYQLEARPELLFALGQAELNLGNYDAAIDYYEKFIATNPGDDQVALAQQAIGATRMRRAQPAPAPPLSEPVPERLVVVHHRRWKIDDTGLVALGGIAVVLGASLAAYSRHLANDRSGTLSDYDARLENARTTRWTGVGIASGGALLVTAALIRWRVRPDGPALAATLTPSSGGLAVVGAW